MPHQRKPKVLIETFGFCLSSIIDNGLITGLFSAIRWTVSLWFRNLCLAGGNFTHTATAG